MYKSLLKNKRNTSKIIIYLRIKLVIYSKFVCEINLQFKIWFKFSLLTINLHLLSVTIMGISNLKNFGATYGLESNTSWI